MTEIKKYSINDTNLFIGSFSVLGAFNMHTRPLQETQYGENKGFFKYIDKKQLFFKIREINRK